MKISCQTAARYIAKAQETRLTSQERVALQVHLGMCKFCSLYVQQVANIRQLLRFWGAGQLPEHIKNKIKKLIFRR
jgi:predicted anti-sigma-YlaC factor YlaD